MKKIIVSVIIAVCVIVAGVGCVVITKIDQAHETEFEALAQDYEAQIKSLEEKNSELEADLEELSDQVYNMKTGEAYVVTIDHDGETHTWESNNERGLFGIDENHYIASASLIG